MIYCYWEFDAPITAPFIEIPYFDRVIIVSRCQLTVEGLREYPTSALRVPSAPVYMHMLLLMWLLSWVFIDSSFGLLRL